MTYTAHRPATDDPSAASVLYAVCPSIRSGLSTTTLIATPRSAARTRASQTQGTLQIETAGQRSRPRPFLKVPARRECPRFSRFSAVEL